MVEALGARVGKGLGALGPKLAPMLGRIMGSTFGTTAFWSSIFVSAAVGFAFNDALLKAFGLEDSSFATKAGVMIASMLGASVLTGLASTRLQALFASGGVATSFFNLFRPAAKQAGAKIGAEITQSQQKAILSQWQKGQGGRYYKQSLMSKWLMGPGSIYSSAAAQNNAAQLANQMLPLGTVQKTFGQRMTDGLRGGFLRVGAGLKGVGTTALAAGITYALASGVDQANIPQNFSSAVTRGLSEGSLMAFATGKWATWLGAGIALEIGKAWKSKDMQKSINSFGDSLQVQLNKLNINVDLSNLYGKINMAFSNLFTQLGASEELKKTLADNLGIAMGGGFVLLMTTLPKILGKSLKVGWPLVLASIAKSMVGTKEGSILNGLIKGALEGAGVGGAMGSVAPGVGTALGGLAGAIAGALAGMWRSKEFQDKVLPAITGFFSWMGEQVLAAGKYVIDKVVEWGKSLTETIAGIWNKAKEMMKGDYTPEKGFQTMLSNIGSDSYGNVGKAGEQAKKKIIAQFNQLPDVVKAGVQVKSWHELGVFLNDKTKDGVSDSFDLYAKEFAKLPDHLRANTPFATLKSLGAQMGESISAGIQSTIKIQTPMTTSATPTTKKAGGGMIRGAGTGTSDSIFAMLSNGEFVVNAAATRKHRSLLEMINGGAGGAIKNGIPHFATGGLLPNSLGGLSYPSSAGKTPIHSDNYQTYKFIGDMVGKVSEDLGRKIREMGVNFSASKTATDALNASTKDGTDAKTKGSKTTHKLTEAEKALKRAREEAAKRIDCEYW